MPKQLTDQAINQYRDDGYFFPVRAISSEVAADTRRHLETFENSQGKPIGGAQRSKSHLLFTWVDALMRNDVQEHTFLGQRSGQQNVRVVASGFELLGVGH